MKRLLALVLVMAFVLAGCGASEVSGTETEIKEESELLENPPEESSEEETTEVVVYEDEIFKATYTGPVDMSMYLEGMGAVGFLIENKTEKEITVYPSDTSVDDFMVMFTSGTPATLQPNKKTNQVWMFVDEDMEFSEFELSFFAVDAEFNDLVTTEIFKVSAK